MENIEVLNFNNAMSLLNCSEASAKLGIKVMKMKIKANEAYDYIQKQLKELKENFKPVGFENLKTELDALRKTVKEQLSQDPIDKEKLDISNMRLTLLQSEWDEKYREAESSFLREKYKPKFELEKITEEEFEILKKPRWELRQINGGENKLVITNHFYPESLAALAPIFNLK